MRTAPCKGCNKRGPYCHVEGNCEAYTQWAKEREEYRNEKRKVTSTEAELQSFAIMCRELAFNSRGRDKAGYSKFR